MWFILGVVTAGVLGLVIILVSVGIAKKSGAKVFGEYDERQQNTRRKAFQYGFFVLLVYGFVYGIYAEFFENPILGPLAGNVLGISIALTVLLSYCIWNDAFLEVGKRPREGMILLGCLGGGNFILGFMHLLNGEIMSGDRVNFYFTNLILGSGLLICMLVLICKRLKDRKEAE